MAPKPLWRLIAGFMWFQVQRIFFDIIESVVLFLNGTRKQIQEAKAPKNYSESARISSVKNWNIFDAWMAYNSTSNLVTWHERFVHPEYVLKDEVSLYCMTDEEAWFVEAPKGIEVWKSEYSAFHKIAQHEYAKKVIKMPLSSFYLLADQIGDIKQKFIFLDFVPRSGSTLVGQIFEETGVCVNYSEPHFLNMYWGAQDHQKLLKVLKAAITFYCKPRKELTSAFIFKSAPMGASLAPIIFELFPDANLFHLTRNAVPNALSLLKISQVTAVARVLSMFETEPFISKTVRFKFFESLNLTFDDFSVKLFAESGDPMALMGFYFHSQVHSIYLEKHSNAPYRMPAIKYEDLLSNREANIRTVFQFCGLDLKLVSKAMDAFGKDSQAGSPLGKDQLKKFDFRARVHSKAILNDGLRLGEHFGLGDVTGESRLPGTITSS